MREITKEMLKIYIPYSNLDWMNYKLVPRDITAHHIIKKEHGGKLEIPNLALIMNKPHQYLHIIEHKDIGTYNSLNKIFKYINVQQYEPTQEQRELIEYLLLEFEKQHIEDTNAKGCKIIKKEFLKRGL